MALKGTLEHKKEEPEIQKDADTSTVVEEHKLNLKMALFFATLSSPNSLEVEKRIQRFEEAAQLAKQNNEKNFSLEKQSYDTNFVQEFIQTLKKKDTTDLKNEFMLDVLMQSAKTDKTGQCFGKTFSNATECVIVMQKIQQSRRLHNFILQHSTSKNNSSFILKDMDKLMDEIKKMFTLEFEVNGKKHNLLLDMSPEKQWRYFSNINEEISSPLDFSTKSWLEAYVRLKKNAPEKLARLYKLMEVSGNPAIRPLKDDYSPVGWIAPETDHFTPDVIGSGGTLYLSSSSMILAELAHAFRNKNNTFGEATQFVRDGLKDILTFNNFGFTRSAQKKNYSDKDKMEYDTHKIVEPAIKGYLDGKIPTIEQMYAQIDERRKKEGIFYSQTDQSKEITKKGYAQNKKIKHKKEILIASAKTK